MYENTTKILFGKQPMNTELEENRTTAYDREKTMVKRSPELNGDLWGIVGISPYQRKSYLDLFIDPLPRIWTDLKYGILRVSAIFPLLWK